MRGKLRSDVGSTSVSQVPVYFISSLSPIVLREAEEFCWFPPLKGREGLPAQHKHNLLVLFHQDTGLTRNAIQFGHVISWFLIIICLFFLVRRMV